MAYRTQARTLYQDEGRVEIDDDAPVSRNKERGIDHGAYVQAWVCVPDPESREELSADRGSWPIDASADVTVITCGLWSTEMLQLTRVEPWKIG